MVGKVTDNCRASASLVAAIMGHSQWLTKNEVLKSVRSHIDGTAEPWEGNEATRWGDNLEPVIIRETAARLKIRNYNGQIDYAIKHPTLPLECSLDAEAQGQGQIIRTNPINGIYCMGVDQITLTGPGVLESKLTSYRPEDRPDLGRGPLQLQAQMMCGGYNWGAIGILYQGIALRTFVFQPHEPTVAAITDAIKDFDDRLRTDPPRWYPLDGSKDAALIYDLGDEEEPIELGPEFRPLAEEYLTLKQTLKDGKEALEVIAAAVQEVMGNHTLATVDGFEIKWPVRHTKAQPEKTVPAKEASSKRQAGITVKEIRP